MFTSEYGLFSGWIRRRDAVVKKPTVPKGYADATPEALGLIL